MYKKTEQEIMQSWKGDLDTPIVTICCTTYNHEPYIAEAIDGFLMQETDFPFEILVRDDCSTDKTAEIVKEYADKYPTLIKPVFEKENTYSKGVKPMPQLYKISQGKYIALCEGDDYWTDPKKLQIQIDLMRENPECHLSFHPAPEEMRGNLTGKVWANHSIKDKIFTDIEMFRSIGAIFCPTASMVILREVMDPIPEFFASAPVGDDFIQYLASLNGGALFIAREMSVYRVGHAESWNQMKKLEETKSIETLIKFHENFTFKYNEAIDKMGNIIDKKYRKEINKRISVNLFSLARLYLNNNMDKDFKMMIACSYDVCGPTSLLHGLLYYLRFSPAYAKKIVNVRNNLYIQNFYSKLKKLL